MNKAADQQPQDDRNTALSWIVQLRGASADDERWQACARWLADDVTHRRSMDAMLDLYDDLGSLQHLHSHEQVTDQPAWWRSWRGAAALAASVLAAVLLLPRLADNHAPVYYQTARGEQQHIELADHSLVTLNTDSRLAVTLSADQRQLQLLRGEAYFDVAPDPRRPFQVDTGAARVTAIGTAFNILRSDDNVQVSVTEGVVRVTELGETGMRVPAAEIVRAHQSLAASGKGLKHAHPVDINTVTAWQRGELVAVEMPLPELISQIERYHDTHIIIGNSSLAARKVSGVFQLRELDALLHALAISLDLQISQLDSKTLQLLPSAQ